MQREGERRTVPGGMHRTPSPSSWALAVGGVAGVSSDASLKVALPEALNPSAFFTGLKPPGSQVLVFTQYRLI